MAGDDAGHRRCAGGRRPGGQVECVPVEGALGVRLGAERQAPGGDGGRVVELGGVPGRRLAAGERTPGRLDPRDEGADGLGRHRGGGRVQHGLGWQGLLRGLRGLGRLVERHAVGGAARADGPEAGLGRVGGGAGRSDRVGVAVQAAIAGGTSDSKVCPSSTRVARSAATDSAWTTGSSSSAAASGTCPGPSAAESNGATWEPMRTKAGRPAVEPLEFAELPLPGQEPGGVAHQRRQAFGDRRVTRARLQLVPVRDRGHQLVLSLGSAMMVPRKLVDTVSLAVLLLR